MAAEHPAAQDRRERDLAIVKRTLEFYGDPSTWGPDDWNMWPIRCRDSSAPRP